MPSYLVADDTSLWPHIFEDGRERMTRFVYDMQQQSLLAVQIQTGPIAAWRNAEQHEFEDVAEDVSVNQPFLDPEAWSLEVVETLPDWAEPIVAANVRITGSAPAA